MSETSTSLEEHIKTFEEKRNCGINSAVTVRYILGTEHGELGELYHDTVNDKNFTLEDWESKGGTEEIYYSCKNIATKLYQHAVDLNNRKPEPLDMRISSLETNIDGQKKVHFYAILDNEVIGTGSISYPYESDAYLTSGFVNEKYRGMGVWKQLFDARCNWIEKNCPVEDLILFVEDKNPMKETYERYGFSTYCGKGETELARTNEGHLWMRKPIKDE